MAEIDAVIRNPIKKALEISEILRDKRVTEIGVVEDVAIELERVRDTMASLLPVEALSKKKFEIREKELVRRKLLSESNVLANDYPPFPMEALTWRNKAGFPRLAIFSLSSPTMRIGTTSTFSSWSYRRGYQMTNQPVLTKDLKKLYKDVFDLTREMAKKSHKSVVLEATFTGLIPLEVKEHIEKVKSNFENIYLVADVPNWVVKKSEPTLTKSIDPLVMGFDGLEYWLIASFDPTSIEKYVESIALKNSKISGD